MAWFVISGVLLLFLALFAEFGTQPAPVVPMGQAIALVMLAFALGCAVAVVERYKPRLGNLLYYVPAFWIFLQQTMQHTSALPLLLYASVFQLLRALLRVTIPSE